MEIKLHIIEHITVISMYSVYIKYIRGKEHIREDAFKGEARGWRSAITSNQHLHSALLQSVWAETLRVHHSAGDVQK